MLNEERGQKVNKLKIVEKERANLGSAKEEAEEIKSKLEAAGAEVELK